MEAADIVKTMMEKDYFSQWLGIEVIEIQPGYCRLEMKVRTEMLNGFSILHGGVAFALADSCFAFACNSRGLQSVSLQASIHFSRPAMEGDVLVAESREVVFSAQSGVMDIEIRRKGDMKLLASFRGTAFVKKDMPWEAAGQ
jgi:acyl-CoA thioesterase